MNKTIVTKWQKCSYDVWGNKRDGYEVNDTRNAGTVELRLKVQTTNAGTPQEFKHATPSNYLLRKVFGVSCHLDTDGDDCVIYVNRRSDGYPIGELRLQSHKALSPIIALDSKEVSR